MHTKVLRLILFIASVFSYALMAQAQCGSRYIDTAAFASVDSFENVIYTTTAGGGIDTQRMDIYQPHGDTACVRHLLVLAHGGAFFQGSKNDGDMEFLCHRFAQRGYVCASMNYRLASSLVDLYDSAQIFKYAYEASLDLRSAIRYFYKDAAQANHWNIDTNAIFMGGSSAGGIAADFAATLDSLAEIAPAFQSIATSNGGINGNSGNDGYRSKVIGVASLAGAVNTVDWIGPGTPPMVMCQGTADGTVPYDCGLALMQYTLGLYPTINFCGSGEMAPKLDSVGVRYSLLPFPGSGHVPWDTNVVIANRMDSAVAAFFYSVNCIQAPGHCSEPAGIAIITDDQYIQVYPNPAADHIEISSETKNVLSALQICDYTGREVYRQAINEKQTLVSVKSFSPGMYILKITVEGSAIPILKKVIVQ